ncbi:MAG: STAS domain-containing protein [Acidimicrobiales bacterium]
MEITTSTEGSQVVLSVAGEVDAHNCQELGAAALAAADEAGSATVVVDATDLSFIDSSAISELLRIREELTERGGSLALRNLGSSVRRVLEITGLLDTFDVS